MTGALLDATREALPLLPFLLVVYSGLEWSEGRMGDAPRAWLLAGVARGRGPLLGAALGCVPQCGFAVVATAIYGRGMLTTGTLLSVYLATSDEALPVLLSHPAKAAYVLPLVATKLTIGALVGSAVDLVARPPAVVRPLAVEAPRAGCGPAGAWTYLLRALRRSLLVFGVYVLVVLALGGLVGGEGGPRLATLLRASPMAPVVSALVGLIPHCAASVAITRLFVDGHLGHGAALSGLCAAAGLAPWLLVREVGPRRAAGVIGFLLGSSVTVGLAVYAVAG